jgi:hypothetical protein
MTSKEPSFDTIKSIEFKLIDFLKIGVAAELAYLMGTLGINPDTSGVAFVFDKIKVTGLIAIPLVVAFLALLFAHWPIKFKFAYQLTENKFNLYYKMRTRNARSIEISDLVVGLKDKSFKAQNNEYGEKKEVFKKYGEYFLLSTINIEALESNKAIKITLSYIDKQTERSHSYFIRDIQIP